MKSAALISIFVMLLSGCSPHTPVPVTTPATMPESFANATDKTTETKIIEPWWQQFNDPELNSLEETLLTNNLQIKQAYAHLAQIAAASHSASSSLFPSINLNSSATKGRQKTATTITTSNSQNVSLAAGYEIDLWQKLKSNRESAQLDFAASREEIKTLYLTLTCQAADLYFLAIEQRAQLKLTDAIIESLRIARDQIKFRYQQGVSTSLALYQADQSLATAKTKKPGIEAALATTENALAVLLGHYPENNTLKSTRELPVPPPAPQTGIPTQLLQQRPDVQRAFLQVKSSDAKTAAAVADRFPTLNLSGSLGASRTATGLSTIHATFWNLIVGLTQPIIDGGRRRAEVDRRQAVTAEAMARYQQVVLKAFQEVENALIANQTAAEQLTLKQMEMATANATLRRATDGYNQGLNDYLAVLTAQRQQHEVSHQLITSQRQLLSARITLWRALGGDWLETNLNNNLLSQTNEEINHEK